MIKRTLLLLVAAALAACAPQAGPPASAEPEALVLAIYDAAASNVGRQATPRDAIPMSDDLAALLDQAEAQALAREEPFIEGDLALNCQDCTSLSDVVVAPESSRAAAQGHAWVKVQFTLNGDEPRTAYYDLVQTPEGWRVDNIVSGNFDLRAEATAYLAEPAAPEEPIAPAP